MGFRFFIFYRLKYDYIDSVCMLLLKNEYPQQYLRLPVLR